MNLAMPESLARSYRNAAQQARVVTEAWGERNLYCPGCPSPYLTPAPTNTQAIDYRCPRCDLPFQLKSQSKPIGGKVLDSAYEAMMSAIRDDRTPNLFLVHYSRDGWRVRNVILIPHFVFAPSTIEKRKALAGTARRAGWVGCYIVLTNIPDDARISLVQNGVIVSSATVREKFRRLEPLKQIRASERGWTLDVLRVVRSLGKREFRTSDMYDYVRHFEQLHPENRHIKDKIRQQLQVLRDRGFLRQVERGVWMIM